MTLINETPLKGSFLTLVNSEATINIITIEAVQHAEGDPVKLFEAVKSILTVTAMTLLDSVMPPESNIIIAESQSTINLIGLTMKSLLIADGILLKLVESSLVMTDCNLDRI
jgi:hypothetical protein